jgi:mono/diheme cytochrome c family protein
MPFDVIAAIFTSVLVMGCIAVGGAHGDEATVDRGKYIFDAGGCTSCHTDEKSGNPPLSGGPALETPFGTFYAPNITPHPDHGIGRWSDREFLRAMREGKAPDGRHYYPAFPYTSYTKASDRDLLDLKAYLFSRPAVSRASPSHDLSFPFSIRSLLWFWKLLNFERSRWKPDPTNEAQWNRGSYLVKALSHCGECHTPRNFLGGTNKSQWMAGARLGAGESVAPNLTSHEAGLADWSERDIAFALDLGITPDNEVLGDQMSLVVRHSTSRLTEADRLAIAHFIKSLPAIPSAVKLKLR